MGKQGLSTPQTFSNSPTIQDKSPPTARKKTKEIKEVLSNHDLSALEAALQLDSITKLVQSTIYESNLLVWLLYRFSSGTPRATSEEYKKGDNN